MENRAMQAAIELEKQSKNDENEQYFIKLQELSQKEKQIDEKLDSQIYQEAMFIKYT